MNCFECMITVLKVFMRCSSGFFCRQDQETSDHYLKHRPLSSIYYAYLTKAAILASNLLTFTVVAWLSYQVVWIAGKSSEQFPIVVSILSLLFIDLMRSVY